MDKKSPMIQNGYKKIPKCHFKKFNCDFCDYHTSNKKDFLKMPIWLPDLETQKNIGEYLGAIDNEIDLLKQLADKYKTQKRGLMQKMLTGEWRVKPEIVNQYMEA